MSFSEGAAWFSVVVLVLLTGQYGLELYQTSAALGHIAPPNEFFLIRWIGYIFGFFFGPVIIVAVIIALLNKDEEDEYLDKDEREVRIEHWSNSVGYYFCIGGVSFGLSRYIYTDSAETFFHIVVFSILLSGIISSALFLWRLRR